MTNICTFCLKLSNDCIILDETLRENIELIFNNVEFLIDDCSMICEECIQKVRSVFELKEASICNEDETSKLRSQKLIDIYLERNKIKCEFSSNELKICRFCINVVPDNSVYILQDKEIDMDIREIITTHLPEVDFTTTNNTIVCKTCLRKLRDYGMLINGWLNIYNLKKNHCLSNDKTGTSDLNEVRKFIFETNSGPQHLDKYYVHGDIKKEIFTEDFENESEGSEKNGDCLVDNIQLKVDMELHELKYSAKEQIKTESVCNDVELRNDGFEMEESKLKIETVLFEPKVESHDYVLKEEEISITDVIDDGDNSAEFEEYSERYSDTRSLCNNQGITQQMNNECSSSEHKVSAERSTKSRFSSRDSSPKMQQNHLSMSKKSIEQLIVNDGFSCSLCSSKSQLEAQVEVHLKNHQYSNYSQLILDEIVHENNYKFENQFGLESSNCSYCHCKTYHEEHFEKHLKIHSSTTKTTYIKKPVRKCYNEFGLHKCEHCDFTTKRKQNLKRHLIVHSEVSNFYKCEHCNFKTKHKYGLKKHLIVHSDESKIYKCEHCDFKSKYKDGLKRHLIVHSDESNYYKCPYCDFTNKRKYNLRRHLIVHSEVSNCYKCEHCDFKTKHKYGLKKHLILHSTESKLYKCEHCDYNTKHQYNIKKHLKVHSGSK